MNSASTSVTRRSEPKRKPSFSMCLKISSESFQTFAPITPARSARLRAPFLRQRVLTSAIEGRLLMMGMSRIIDAGARHVRTGYGTGERHCRLRGEGIRAGHAAAAAAGGTRRSPGAVPRGDHGPGGAGHGEELRD